MEWIFYSKLFLTIFMLVLFVLAVRLVVKFKLSVVKKNETFLDYYCAEGMLAADVTKLVNLMGLFYIFAGIGLLALSSSSTWGWGLFLYSALALFVGFWAFKIVSISLGSMIATLLKKKSLK